MDTINGKGEKKKDLVNISQVFGKTAILEIEKSFKKIGCYLFLLLLEYI